MSTRVCLILCGAWLLLAAAARGQVGFPAKDASAIDSQAMRHVSPATAENEWLPLAAQSGELVSNAPRSISSPGTAADGVAQAASDASVRRSAGDRQAEAPMPLPPRSQRETRQRKLGGSSTGGTLFTVLSSLTIVLAVFFAFVWLTRKTAPKGMAPLPKEVVESLGRAPLLGRQQMQMVRVGGKLILLSVTNTGVELLTEITDPEEVDRLSGLCRQAQPGSISDTFRQVLAQASTEPATSPRGESRQVRRAGSMEPHRA